MYSVHGTGIIFLYLACYVGRDGLFLYWSCHCGGIRVQVPTSFMPNCTQKSYVWLFNTWHICSYRWILFIDIKQASQLICSCLYQKCKNAKFHLRRFVN